MKILNNNKIVSINKKDTKQQRKNNLQEQAQKQVQANALDIIGVQNQSFCGFRTPPASAQFLHQDLDMMPRTPYVVCDDSVFELGPYAVIDLSSREIKQMVQSLKPNGYIDFGRNKTLFNGIDDYVSGAHLRINKKHDGTLIATDLDSTNGTVIRKNLAETPSLNTGFCLKPNLRYELPLSGAIRLCKNEIFYLPNLEKRFQSMKEGETLLMGRDASCDIRIEDPSVSRKHLSLSKHGHNVVIKDLDSTNGVRYIPEDNTNVEDSNLSKLQDIMFLKPETQTRIPNDCQLYLGDNFTIDVRNPNVLGLLDRYRTVTLGRGSDCIIQVNPFYDQVSHNHLMLEKKGDEIYATDLGSKNGTKVVPHSKIKPFYCDLSELELSQANVGDCYLLSTIYGMSRSKKGRKLLEDMVQVDRQGNYIVTFYKKEPIKVKLEELDGQIKDNQEKRSVSGDLGIKAIERAYAKMLKEEEKNIFSPNDYNPTMFAQIDDGGFMSVALEKMTGIKSKSIYGKNPVVFSSLYKLSQNLDDYIVTCSTYSKGRYGRYMDPRNLFIAKHAYSIKSIDTNNKTVEIVNPHNTKKTHHISWWEFQDMFDFLCYADVSS